MTGIALWSVAITRRTAKRSLRAYVQMYRALVRFEGLAAAGPFKCHLNVIMKNTGQTPAQKIRVWLHATMHSDETAQAFEFEVDDAEMEKRNPSVLGRDQLLSHTLTLTFAHDAYQAVADGSLTLYVWGRASYDDIFGETHRTNFRQQHTAQVMNKDVEMKISVSGNDAT